jgi:hypothetical protein
VPLGGRDPRLAVFRAVAAHAVLHDDDRLVGVVTRRPEALQDERPVRAERVDIGQAGPTRARQGLGKIGGAHRGCLAVSMKADATVRRPYSTAHGARVVISHVLRYHIPAMTTFLTVLLVLAMLGVLGVLGVGVATMIRGGNPRLSNRLMQGRVVMQAVALALLALLMMLAAGGHR